MLAKMRRWNLERLETRHLLAGDLVISEFMADNASTIKDAYGELSDWVELHNDSNQTVELEGWRLTDDPLDLSKWTFDAGQHVDAHGRLLIWASDRDVVTADGEIHTNFRLKASGEYLALINPGGDVVSAFGNVDTKYPSMSEDVSYGIGGDGRQRHFLNPTPNLPNDDNSGGVVADTKFSVDRGFFTEAFSVVIRSETPGASLAYTWDGTAPSPTHGIQVVGDAMGPSVTLTVDSTSTVRAMAYLADWTSTNVDTQTYLFPEQVVRQSSDGLPNTWGHDGADYEMDPRIVDSPLYRDVIVDSLQAIPTVSLVADIDSFFGQGGIGIYPKGQNSPRVVSMEWLLPATNDAVQVEASVEIAGGSSTDRWKSDKLSMQLKFKQEYGDAKLRYPIFGKNATDSFDTLILDARLNQTWHYGGGADPDGQRRRAQYTRDQYVANLQRTLGGFSPHGRWVHLYLNGIYWGMYNLHERPDEHFAQDYLGGEKADYDIVKHNDDVVNGSFDAYQTLLNSVRRDVRQEAAYREVEQMLDVDGFVNYMLTNYFVGNTDWGHQNWYASRNAISGDGKWRYHSWDAELVLKELNDNVTGRGDALGPTGIHHQLMRNAEYRLKFMDAVQATMFNDGKLAPLHTAALYQQSLDMVREAVVAESARWGDNRRAEPYTRDGEWQAEANRLLDDYFPARTAVVLEQFRDQGFFHDYDAPKFHQHGGEVPQGYAADIVSEGSIFYTTDGTDPRVSATAIEYDGPIVLTESREVRARARRGRDEWSAVTIAKFQVPVIGDFSRNGVLDSADLDVLARAIASNEDLPDFDLDDSGRVDARDIDYWLEQLADTRRGDADLDGDVDFGDFLVVSRNFGSSEKKWRDGNFNSDNVVNFTDFLLLSGQFGWNRENA